MINKESVTKRIAIHESGHCVAAYLLHYSVEEVSIFVDKYHYNGFVIFDSDSGRRTALQSIDEQGLIHCAGNAAESLYFGRRYWSRHSSDYIKTANSLSWLYGSKDEIVAGINFLWLRAKNLLAEPANWYAVTDLAGCIKESQQECGYWDEGKYHVNYDYENTFQIDGYKVRVIISKALEWYEQYGSIPKKIMVFKEV